MKINTGREQSRGKHVKWKKKAGKQESVMNIRVYSPADQIQPFHKGWTLGHGCYILPICLSHLWYSIIHHCGGCSLYWAGQLLAVCLSVCLSPPFSLTHTIRHVQTLPLSACGFKAWCWRIYSDSTGFRAQWQRKGGRWRRGSKRVVWKRRQMNQRKEKQEQWQWNQHHCVSSWHNWLYQRQFCKPLTSPFWGCLAAHSTENLHMGVCVCMTALFFVCIKHLFLLCL